MVIYLYYNLSYGITIAISISLSYLTYVRMCLLACLLYHYKRYECMHYYIKTNYTK